MNHYYIPEIVTIVALSLLLVIYAIYKFKKAIDEMNEYHATLETLGDTFYSMHILNLIDDTVIEFNANDTVKAVVNHKQGATTMMSQIMAAVSTEDYLEEALEFTDLTTVADRMINKKVITRQLLGKNAGWYLASFIAMEKDDNGRPTKVIFITQVNDEEKKQEEKLIKKAQTDELTGLLNRRSYEEDIYAHNDIPESDEFIYVSLDANGLKIINDTKGHMAGDEMIIGACTCMKNAFGTIGKLYRIGGDEFVAILLCSVDKAKELLQKFDEEIANWSGKLVESLSISYGWTSREENLEASVRELGSIAEKRMYEAKAAHYRKMGFDRRGQQDAHKALCELYTKILRINTREDSYQIVNIDESELVAEKGFSNKISDWLIEFGKSGQVHPDDLEDYLQATKLENIDNYFTGNKTSLHIFYRRKYKDEYKQSMLEIIPSNEHESDNHSFFLYVKDIDK